jgi:hypothetical protein
MIPEERLAEFDESLLEVIGIALEIGRLESEGISDIGYVNDLKERYNFVCDNVLVPFFEEFGGEI